MLSGATSDLSRRKLLLGLFHLASAGFISGCRIIDVALDDIDAEGARLAVVGRLRCLRGLLDCVRLAAGPVMLEAAVDRAECRHAPP